MQKKNKWGNHLLSLEKSDENPLIFPIRFSEYALVLIEAGTGEFRIDEVAFKFSGPALLFATPMQTLQLDHQGCLSYSMIKFHSDFYCIETHREEVGCNGLLFNNIYIRPWIALDETTWQLFDQWIQQLQNELGGVYSEMVMRSFLQLILAKSSDIKLQLLELEANVRVKDESMEQFRKLLDQHFLQLHKPMDYAELLHISTNLLSKKSLKYFGKTPSQLIQERLILEAKKKLHLTNYSIKEIAFQMQFSDAYYFSRFFKKHTRVSPQLFRKRGGISEIAYLSK